MAFDPFADDNNDDKKDDKVTETPETTQDSGITISHKPTAGYDSALIVLKGGGASGVMSQYDDPNFMPLVTKAAKADAWIKKEFAEHAPPREAGGSAPAAQRTPPSNSAPSGETKQCKHGDMTFRSGTKNGKVWKGFFCPTPQGTPDQCSPEFIR